MNNKLKKNIHIDLYEDNRFFVKSNPTFSKILSICMIIIRTLIVLFFFPLIIINYIYNIKYVKYIVKLSFLFFYILLIYTLFIIIRNDLIYNDNNYNKDKIILNLDYKEKIKDF